jgi:hypothetical protein
VGSSSVLVLPLDEILDLIHRLSRNLQSSIESICSCLDRQGVVTWDPVIRLNDYPNNEMSGRRKSSQLIENIIK